MGSDKAAEERRLIREAAKRIASGNATRDQYSDRIEEIVSAFRRDRPEDASAASKVFAEKIGDKATTTLLDALKDAALHRNRTLGIPERQMRRELDHLSFGIRVLELREDGYGQRDAIRKAFEETGRDAISDQKMRANYWDPFVELVKARDIIPYFSIDEETGLLSPTEFVPAEMAGKRGRPPKKK